jgi:hypothetical protein
LVILDHEVQAQHIVLMIAQPKHDTSGAQPLADCSKHFSDELLWRGFSCQHVEAAHHHFHVAAGELLGSAQSLLSTVTLDRDPDKVRR